MRPQPKIDPTTKIRKDAIFARSFKCVARMERSVIRDCHEASMPPRISLRSIRATLAEIPPEQLQNTDNVIPLPTLLHEAVNAEYSSRWKDTNMTRYEWLQTRPYDVQREEGLKILRELHILK